MKIKTQSAVILLLVVATFIIAFVFMRMDMNFEVVDQKYIKAHVGKPGFVLLDVREARIYNGASPFEGIPGGHIPGSVNFPSSELKDSGAEEALAKIGVTKDVTVIVQCNRGRLSSQFAEALVKDFGFDASRIKNYKEGMMDWARNPTNVILPEGHESGASGDKRPASF